MLITLEHQQAMIDNYSKHHNTGETLAFIDGMKAMLDYVEFLDNQQKQ